MIGCFSGAENRAETDYPSIVSAVTQDGKGAVEDCLIEGAIGDALSAPIEL